jgi:hypothetical protein
LDGIQTACLGILFTIHAHSLHFGLAKGLVEITLEFLPLGLGLLAEATPFCVEKVQLGRAFLGRAFRAVAPIHAIHNQCECEDGSEFPPHC